MRKRLWAGGFILKGIYWIDRRRRGIRHRFSTQSRTPGGAAAQLKAWEEDPSGNYRPRRPGPGGSSDIGEAIGDYIKASAARNSTAHVKLQGAALQRWRVYLGANSVSALQGITPALGAGYVPWRKAGGGWLRRGSRKSVQPYPGGPVGDAITNRDLAALKAMMTWAREVAQIVPPDFDPLRAVKFLREFSDVRPHRDVEQAHVLAARAKLSERWARVVTVLYGTGLRYDSLARLRPMDCFQVTGTDGAGIIRDPYPKGKVAVEVPASKEVMAAALWLAGQKKHLPRDHASQLDRRLRTACELAGVSRFTAHDLRVACATFWHRSGTPIGDIQRLLGHSSAATTAKYVRASRKPVIGPV